MKTPRKTKVKNIYPNYITPQTFEMIESTIKSDNPEHMAIVYPNGITFKAQNKKLFIQTSETPQIFKEIDYNKWRSGKIVMI